MSATLISPALARFAPWTDKKGRLHPFRAAVLLLLLAPGLWLAFRWETVGLGARPVNAAIHGMGYWAVWILLASLAITPAKALTGMPNIAVVRRMVGVAALAYALIHLSLYVIDQNWRLLTVATEILVRPYLTIGFVALVGLCVLGATSTDAAVRRLGTRWKRLHKWVYGIAVLTAVHFFLQSKADVSQATVAAGVFAWLMLWRRLPAGRDREALPLLGLALAAALVTAAAEWGWYRFGTKIDPARVLRGELDVSFGLRPAALVLALGLLVAGAVALRRVAQSPLGARLPFTMLVYAAGAFADDLIRFLFGWQVDDTVDGPSPLLLNGFAVGVFALLGVVRHHLPDGWQRRTLDAIWAACAVYPLLMLVENPTAAASAAVLVAAGVVWLATRLWPLSRGRAMLLVPMLVWVAFEASLLI